MKLKHDVAEGTISGIFRAYPLLDNQGKNLWQGKFTAPKALKVLREKLSQEAWTQEYLLSLDSITDYARDDREPKDLNSREKNDAVILAWYHWQRAKLGEQYRVDLSDAKLQAPLINQMRQFQINAPITVTTLELADGDPRYEKYQEYLEKQKILTKTFHQALQRAIRERSLERAKVEGEKK